MNTTTKRGTGNRRVNRRKIYIAVAAAALAAVAGSVAGIASASSSGHGTPAGYPADKAARMQHEIDQVGSLPARHKPTEEQGRAAAAAADRNEPARTAGINNTMHQGPFPAIEFRVHNFYQGPVAGQWYLVYAGSLTAAANGADHAAVRVLAVSPTGQLTPVGTFRAPGQITSIRISGYSDTTLTLQGGGRTLTFDLRTLSFS
jgi:hypothetical protein